MDTILLFVAALLCVITAFIHSYFGEKRLIGPIIDSEHGVMKNPLAKQVIRFAWHWTSLLWVIIAVFLAFTAQEQITHRPLILIIGVSHLVGGVVDGVFTRGKHIGWPPITIIGVLVLATLM